MPHLIESPAAWRGKELFAASDWLHLLGTPEVAELQRLSRAPDDTEREPTSADSELLPSLSARFTRIQTSLEEGPGAVLMRGLPVTEISAEQATRIFWAVVQRIGTPVSQSATGERIFHVRDEGFRLDDPRARGPNTRKKLSFHTDRCDVIAFMCLRQAKSGGENDLVSSATLYNEVLQRRPDLLAELMKPYRYQRHNVDRGNELPYCRQPIFSFCEGHFAANYLRVLIERAYASPGASEMTERAREALDYLDELAEDPRLHVRIRQQPGDVLLLNNWVTLHRRTEFEDHPEPQRKRHILRVWLSMPNSRPIDPRFKDNYGATEAGELRGGMRPSRP